MGTKRTNEDVLVKEMDLNSIQLKMDSDNTRTFSGYLSVFGGIDSYGDTVLPGAFKKSLARLKKEKRHLPILEQHGHSSSGYTPIGVWTELKEDSIGLKATGRLYSTSRGEDFYKILKESPVGAIGLSIGYYRDKFKPNVVGNKSTGGYLLEELDLYEGTVTAFPADGNALILEVKEEDRNTVEDEERKTVRDLEKHLKTSYGFSSREAKKLISELKAFDVITFIESEKEDAEIQSVPESQQNDVAEPKLQDTDTKEQIDTKEAAEVLNLLISPLVEAQEERKKKEEIKATLEEIWNIFSKN